MNSLNRFTTGSLFQVYRHGSRIRGHNAGLHTKTPIKMSNITAKKQISTPTPNPKAKERKYTTGMNFNRKTLLLLPTSIGMFLCALLWPEKKKSTLQMDTVTQPELKEHTGIVKNISTVYSSTESVYRHHNKEVKPGLNSVQQIQNLVDRNLAKVVLENLERDKHCYRRQGNHHLFQGEYGLWNRVVFDPQHKPGEIKAFTYDYSKEAQTVIKSALEKFGELLKLEGEHEIAIQFNRTIIDDDPSLNRTKWKTQCASWTMHILLSDPEDPVTGWKNGNLSRSTYYIQRKPIGVVQPLESIEKHSYKLGDAILFQQFGSLHKQELIEPKFPGQSPSRTVLEVYLKDTRNDLLAVEYSEYIDSEDIAPMEVKFIEPSSDEI